MKLVQNFEIFGAIVVSQAGTNSKFRVNVRRVLIPQCKTGPTERVFHLYKMKNNPRSVQNLILK